MEAVLEELKLFALKDFSGHLAASKNAMLPKDDNPERKGRVKPSERFQIGKPVPPV